MSWFRKIGIIIGFISLGCITNAQDSSKVVVQTSICVQNAYSLYHVLDASILIQELNEAQEIVTTEELSSEISSQFDFEAGKIYKILVEKEGYYSIDTLFDTNKFKRKQKYRFGVYLLPIVCYQVNGVLQDKVDQTLVGDGQVLIVDSIRQDSQWVEVKNGAYEFCGECGRTYLLKTKLKGYLSAKQEIILTAKDCKTEKVQELNLDLELVSTFKDGYYKGDSIQLKELKFEGKTSKLTVGGIKELRRLVDILKNIPELNVSVIIHTNAQKSHRYNQLLSEKRAEEVRAFLLKEGIAERRFEVIGMGEEFLLDKRKQDKNNRGELVVLQGNLDK